MRRAFLRRVRNLLARVALASCLAAGSAVGAAAQSGDAGFPTPVFSNEIGGRIAPRDFGDARLTRHFYTFRGTEGDLSLTVESAELSGDVDLFAAQGLRPLTKITLFGSSSPAKVSKTIYLQGEETLVLRVEARSIGDAEGTYRVRLDGAFAPAPTSLANVPEPTTPTLSDAGGETKGTRVTATGERIAVPEPVAAAPEPTPETATATPATETASEPAAAPRTPPRPRGNRGARGSARTKKRDTAPPPTAETSSDAAPADSPPAVPPTAAPADAAAGGAPPGTETPAARAPRSGRSGRGSRRRASNAERPAATTPDAGAATSPAPAEAERTAPNSRLVIVTKSGETLERDMNTVRRVTVENNQIVVVGKDGKVVRQPLANVLRMSIEPQP